MKFFMGLFLLVLVACSGKSNSPVTGTNAVKSRSIVGGSVVSSTDPLSMSMVRISSSAGLCSGTVIDTQHVLTAAHCVSTAGATIDFGSAGLRNAQVLIHENYQSQTTLTGWRISDIALLRFSGGLPTGYKAIPLLGVALSQTNGFSTAGFGQTSPTAQDYGTLRKVGLPSTLLQYQTEIIALTGQGACFGDSGGALTTQIAGQTVQVGISTNGLQNCSISIFQDVRPYISWIRGKGAIPNILGDSIAPLRRSVIASTIMPDGNLTVFGIGLGSEVATARNGQYVLAVPGSSKVKSICIGKDTRMQVPAIYAIGLDDQVYTSKYINGNWSGYSPTFYGKIKALECGTTHLFIIAYDDQAYVVDQVPLTINGTTVQTYLAPKLVAPGAVKQVASGSRLIQQSPPLLPLVADFALVIGLNDQVYFSNRLNRGSFTNYALTSQGTVLAIKSTQNIQDPSFLVIGMDGQIKINPFNLTTQFWAGYRAAREGTVYDFTPLSSNGIISLLATGLDNQIHYGTTAYAGALPGTIAFGSPIANGTFLRPN